MRDAKPEIHVSRACDTPFRFFTQDGHEDFQGALPPFVHVPAKTGVEWVSG